MKITEVKVREFGKGNLKGFADVTFDNCFVVKGLKIMNGQNGIFVNMPSQEKKGEYFDTAFPITKEFRQELVDAVLSEYGSEDEKNAEGTVVNNTVVSTVKPNGLDEDEFPF